MQSSFLLWLFSNNYHAGDRIAISRAESYQKMRGMSYQEVVQTHGQISFPEVLRKEKAL